MQFIARMIVSSRKLNLSLGRDTDATMLASCWSVTVFRAGAQHRQLVRPLLSSSSSTATRSRPSLIKQQL